VEHAIEGVAGVTQLKVEPQVLVPQIEVRLRPEAAVRHGLTPAAVRRAAETVVRGVKVGESTGTRKSTK
jgi:Cu/Ag efflux pump CusA